ncbi:MAG: hypothetical protein V4641_01965 [Pseudomonadota bacterium]
MSTISQLTSVDTVVGADAVPIYSSANGDARKASLSVIAAYIQTILTAAGLYMTQYAAPVATATNTQVAPATDGESVYLLLTPTGTFATGTITLPAKALCQDGQELLVSCTQIVTALTVAGNGATVNGAPTALAANGFFRLRFDGIFQSWYRVG